MTKLEKAINFTKENMEKIQNRPLYHLTPQIGWLNDPNGFCEYKGEYHLFYQHYPYGTTWGDMHWGHGVSKDLVKWDYNDIAMANDTIADANGCFSGSAIEKNGELYLMYTGHINPNYGFDEDIDQLLQHQCIARSKDGIKFEKAKENPVISRELLPKEYKISDFRDPKVWEKGGVYYAVHAVKNTMNRGELILYKSKDLVEWEFLAPLFQTDFSENKMLECPDFFHLDGKEVLIYSGMPCMPEFEGTILNTIEYHIGSLDYNTGIFTSESKGYLDYGDSYYAPQTTGDSKGRRLLVAWMKKWTSSYIQLPKEFEWNGMMTMVRELKIVDGKLVQLPLKELNNYAESKLRIENEPLVGEKNIIKDKISAKKVSLLLEKMNEKVVLEIFNDTRIEFEKNRFGYISDFYNKKEEYFLEESILDEEGKLKVEVYIDLYSIEILVNGGKNSFTYTNFNVDKNINVNIKSNKEVLIRELEVFDLNI